MTSPLPFRQALAEGRVLIADGATGTNLQLRGLPVGTPSDLWVIENPEQVLALHAAFLDAGADILLTDTFGSSPFHLQRMLPGQDAKELNLKAVALARQAIGERPAWVAGSIGPAGELLAPFGELSVEMAETSVARQARALAEAGVDLLVVETQFDLNEAAAAVRGVRSVTDLPLVCSFSYDRGTRTMMGVRPAQMAEAIGSMGVDALGINCGRSLEDNLKALEELRAATDLPLWFKPNAGLPRTDEQGSTNYDVTPQDMGSRATAWLDAGAQIIGGCCGTTPEHIRAIAENLAAARAA